MKSETKEFWLDLADKYLRNSFSVAVTAKPCEKLAASIGEEDKRRVEERKKTLGKKGLKELKQIVDNAIEENDVGYLLKLKNFCSKYIMSFDVFLRMLRCQIRFMIVYRCPH